MDYINYVIPITAFLGVIFSLISILYTKQQNTRRLEVNLDINDKHFHLFHDPEDLNLELTAFNSGFRAVAIIKYEFFANGEKIVFDLDDSYPNPTKKNTHVFMHPKSHDKLPHVLKEGELTNTTINYIEFVHVLKRRKFKGSIKVYGYKKPLKIKFTRVNL